MTTPPDTHTNKLHFGGNLPILRDNIPDESVDLIYLDPPRQTRRRQSPSKRML